MTTDSEYQEAPSDTGCPAGYVCDFPNCPHVSDCVRDSIEADSEYDPTLTSEDPEIWSDAP